MVTYRKELERKGWHRPWPIRVLLVVVGVGLLLGGWVAWDLEQEKGGWEGSGLGHHMIEETPDRVIVRGEDGAIVFEGSSIQEVEAWIEGQRSRNFTVPILLLAGGAVLLVLGVAPSPRRPEHPNAEPREVALT